MKLSLPLGIDNFAKVRENRYYYIDKTAIIKKLLDTQFEANLITCPRRFGKSLTVSMLEDFFDISRSSKAHFDGLEISRDTELCEKWMNQYPVIALTKKSVEGLNYENAYGKLRILIASVCKKYAFLADSERVDSDDRVLFKKLKAQEADRILLSRTNFAHGGA